ncbi:MAG TPA: isoleucine--tRNA ligase [bacterium]|nr:isoleucine--tRNA ligase [bacterium]
MENKTNNQGSDNPLVAAEETVLNFWEQADIFNKSLRQDNPAGEFVFYEGPPTANGMPGIHHVLARSFKDVIPRYKTMSGFLVRRKAGWDTHGLPVELQVEKELGISGKPEIEKYGIEAFNKKCRESVWKFKDEWEKLTRRTAYWVDMAHPYVTYENYYIESLWWIISQINTRGLLYEGHKVVPHCPRCGTALSSHEVAQGYKLTKDNSVYLKFKVKTGNGLVNPGDIILAWTTTPWTLPGNVALAVGENMEYVKVAYEGENYIVAKKRLEDVFAGLDYQTVGEKLEGEDLLNVEYEPLFDLPALRLEGKPVYVVLPANFVTTDDGTGVVHTAVMYGEDDYTLGDVAGLPKVHTVNEEGNFNQLLEPYGLAGKFVKDPETEKIILNYLENKGVLFKQAVYEHDYPFCWRCDTPLLYYAKNSWFIAMSRLREDLLKNNQQVNWVPEHIKEGRFGEWLTNAKDWAISRERYWGTPLPIWRCDNSDCHHFEVIGGVADLKSQAINEVPADLDLHRPFLDEIKIKCPKCSSDMHRVKEVFDCWFDSGSMSLAQYHYPFENKELIDSGQQFPADFICEAIDQTRGWFYTLLAVSTALGRGVPYKNVVCLGHINDKYGKKMSKSKGNIISPWEVISQYGVDAVRQHMYTINQPGEGKKYDLNDVKDVFRQNIMTLWNVYKFWEMYAVDYQAQSDFSSNNILDIWIISKLNKLVNKIKTELDVYHIYESARELPLFIGELSTWYLRRSRDRFKGEDQADKEAAIQTMGQVFLTLAKVMAPFMPFLAENLWQKVTGHNFNNPDASVHLEKWPLGGEINEAVLEKMELVFKIVELGLAERDKAGIKVRQVLSTVKASAKEWPEFSEDYLFLIKDELNVKEVKIEIGDNENINLVLDTEITPELKLEGLKRELVRFINMQRKAGGLSIGDQAKVTISQTETLSAVVAKFGEEIKKDTLVADINLVAAVAGGEKIKIDGAEVELLVEKI